LDEFGPNGRRCASVFMQCNDHDCLGLVALNGSKKARIILRAINNGCRFSLIQSSGMRHICG
jgi:hypothetical protein